MNLTTIIQRVIEDVAQQPGMKQLGQTHIYGLRAIQKMPFAQTNPAEWEDVDVIEFVKWRRRNVCAATALQTLSMILGVLKYAASTWRDCRPVAKGVGAIAAAKPYLDKHQLIGKSEPRKRVPTEEEIQKLLDYYLERQDRCRIRMPALIAFALASTRRISEICRIEHGDIDWNRREGPMYMVRDLKHPKKKLGNHKWFPLTAELAEIVKAQPRMTTDPRERVFPFNSKSASASYTSAKKALGIVGLRFHDNRRQAITTWLARLKNPHKVKLISGHETTQILERVYDATDPATIHQELRA